MRISDIHITNFRSIREASISPSAFNVFVGQNNHGKTNVFEALNWFYGAKMDATEISYRRNGGEVIVEIEFSGVQDGIERMQNEAKKTTVRAFVAGSDTIKIRKSTLQPKRLALKPSTGEWEDIGTGFDNALNDLLPRFEYVHTRLHVEDVATFGKKTPIGIMLSGVLAAILEENPDYQAFKLKFEELFGRDDSEVRVKLNELSGKVEVYLQKQFPDCTEVEFKVTQPQFEDLLKNFETSIDDGISTDVSEKGDGMQRALMLAILQTYADYRKQDEDIGKSFLFFIDEGELHLHPTAQRKLKNALIEIASRDDQVFLNTHSSVLVVDEHEIQKIFRVEKIAGETNVLPTVEGDKHGIVYELLGGSPADLLLPRNFLVVEGKSEWEFLSKVIKRFYMDRPTVQIVYGEGDHREIERSMHAINKAFVALYGSPVYRDKLTIVCDSPHESRQTDFDEFCRSYAEVVSDNRLFQLEAVCLEMYYPAPWQVTEERAREMGQEQNSKIQLARKVGEEITQEIFERDMPIMFSALQKCWELAYQ